MIHTAPLLHPGAASCPTSGAAVGPVPPGLLEPVPREHLRDVDRDLAALELDRWLRVLAHQDALCRRVFGHLAAAFLHHRAHHRLAFGRLTDYAEERLGLSAREMQSAARVATALVALPRLGTAFEAGQLSWTQLRLLVTVANPATEAQWLEIARGRTARGLEALVRLARTDANAGTGGGRAAEAADGAGAAVGSGGKDPSRTADDEEVDGEPRARFHLRCPRRVRGRWRHVVELARRMLGTDGPVWQAAEAIAAEGLAAAPATERTHAPSWNGEAAMTGGDSVCAGAGGTAAARDAGATDDACEPGAGSRDAAATADPPPWACFACLDCSAVEAVIPDDVARLALDAETLDAFALDARLRQVLHAQRRIDWQTGRLLHTFLRLHLERLLGFPSVEAYVRERLGRSPRTARALVAVERTTWEMSTFGAAYEAGALSWARALAILPVLREGTETAWTARAQEVTVRRLVAEVNWSLDRWDADPALSAPLGPPPAGHDLRGDTERQMRAPLDWSPIDAEIAFAGPLSVVRLMQHAAAACARPGEPRWVGLERLLIHVDAEWQALPPHRDPIFARDGWRCAVPACGSRRNLHDHHMQFRTLGGGNERKNRVTVCAWHHLRGLHGGMVRASGVAPAAVRWELGLRPGLPPLLSCIGDVYVAPETSGRPRGSNREDSMAA